MCTKSCATVTTINFITFSSSQKEIPYPYRSLPIPTPTPVKKNKKQSQTVVKTVKTDFIQSYCSMVKKDLSIELDSIPNTTKVSRDL